MRKENRTLKQILAKLLVFALVFQLAVPVGAAPVAEEVSVTEAMEEIEKDALPEVTEEETVAEGEGEEIIDAPAEWFQIENGVLIKYLGSGIKDDNRPVRVKIPDGVTKIKQFAFQNSNNDYKCNYLIYKIKEYGKL